MSSHLATAVSVALCTVVLASGAAAQDRSAFPVALDAFVRRAMTAVEAVPGVAVAVVDDEGAVHTAGYGLADVERRSPVTADTPFYIASSTKSFTALAIAALASRGELDLDAPLAQWVPDSGIPADLAGRVTLTDLLSHRSGVDNAAIAYRVAFTGDWTPEGLWHLTGETRPLEDTPHGTFNYGNAGYNLATVLIEHRLGRDWSRLVSDEVLTPLGMVHTTAAIDEARASGRVVAPGHLGLEPGPARPSYLQKTDATMHSAGGLVSTANDMARWLEAQIGDGIVDGRRVFPEGLIASTHVSRVDQEATFGSYVRTGYGLGWQVGRYDDDQFLHHFGNFSGSRAHVSFMPGRRLGVAVLINEDAVAGELADVVAGYVYDWFAGVPDLEATYDARVAELVVVRDARREGLVRGVRARAQRPRTLTLPDDAYVGDYASAAFGVMRIRAIPSGLEAAIGVQHARAENFTAPESLRVELTPLRGEVIVFGLDAGGRPDSLTYQGEVFRRQ
tara:strand:+ start:1303 stop:2817 length:1515 start_codon:yes stop_codon:yes gene_type:complete